VSVSCLFFLCGDGACSVPHELEHITSRKSLQPVMLAIPGAPFLHGNGRNGSRIFLRNFGCLELEFNSKGLYKGDIQRHVLC